jgi:hypothetical protein
MPFKSRKQQRACYASDGFGGAVDCDEFSRETKGKDIPESKSRGSKKKGSAKKLPHGASYYKRRDNYPPVVGTKSTD